MKLEPEILALAVSSNNGLSQESSLKVGGGDAIDDLGVGVYYRPYDCLPHAVVLYGPPSRLHLRKLRHSRVASSSSSSAVRFLRESGQLRVSVSRAFSRGFFLCAWRGIWDFVWIFLAGFYRCRSMWVPLTECTGLKERTHWSPAKPSSFTSETDFFLPYF